MIDLSGYVKKPCIRLEPKGIEPAEVYCRKYAAVYQKIADTLNGGKSIGSYITDRSGMSLLYVGVTEDGQVYFNGHEIDAEKRLNSLTGNYETGLARARPFSVLEKIASEAGFDLRVEIAQPFMDKKYRYQPKKEDEDPVLGEASYFLGLAGSTPKNQAPTKPSRVNPTALVPATPRALEAKPGRISDTLEMFRTPSPHHRLIGYEQRGPDTLVAARTECLSPEPTLQGFQPSLEQLN